MNVPAALIDAIKKAHSLLLVTHVNPDGDAVGSVLGLGKTLQTLGKQVRMTDRDPVPLLYRFLPGWEEFGQGVPEERCDLMVILDCGDLERTGLEGFQAEKIAVIDHHLTHRADGDIRWVATEASSTGEMVYALIRALGVPLSAETARCLFAAIFTDTGGFRYASTTPFSLRAGADLVGAGANPWEVAERIYESMSEQRLRLVGRMLGTLTVDGTVGWVVVTQEMFRETGTGEEDTENFANYPRMVEGIEVAILFREQHDGMWKVSLRGKGRVNLAAVAETFGGGGHRDAAGCRVPGNSEEVRERVLRAVKDALRNH